MAYESGGRADKYGNRFEYNWVIKQLLDIIDEQIDYVIIEAIGKDENGVDIWIGNKNGKKEAQQCKGRNSSNDIWQIGDLHSKGILKNWLRHLQSDVLNEVALISPLSFTFLEDLVSRANNNNSIPQDFYNYQIEKSDKKFVNFYKKFCKYMEIDYTNDSGIIQSINFLKRIHYRQWPDSESKEIVLNKIKQLLIGDPENIYGIFLEFALTENILGKKIDLQMLKYYLNQHNIFERNLSHDERIHPKIDDLNNEYKSYFYAFNGGLIPREEVDTCKDCIENEESIIIHGIAGIGKSGCVENIIKYLEKNGIPYAAVKLDKRFPKSTTEQWGYSMGLPASISHCLDSISKNKKAVIILDQLDALRWTQTNSGNALNVIMKLINEVENLNVERKHKISIIMVCRTYDLDNDKHIKNLIKEEYQESKIHWNKIKVNELNNNTVKEIIGSTYDKINPKLKKLLCIPNNLYIWQHLENNLKYQSIENTTQLIQEWWNEIENKAYQTSLIIEILEKFKMNILDYCNKKGLTCVPKLALNLPDNYISFLQSNGLIIVSSNNMISFIHQSILDCFISESMVNKYLNTEKVDEITGPYLFQTPTKRYQIQLFLEQLLGYSEDYFLDASMKILDSDTVRYNIKFVIFEILSQIENPEKILCDFIIENIEDTKWSESIITNVIFGHVKYVDLLLNKGILEKWMMDSCLREKAINLITSISPNYSEEFIKFIELHIFEMPNEDFIWNRCFQMDINYDSNLMFELRMKFYEKYPYYSTHFIDFKSMIMKCEVRTIRLLNFILNNSANEVGRKIYNYEEEYLIDESDLFIADYEKVIDILLPSIPKEDVSYTSWSSRYTYGSGIERACIQILKKANKTLIMKEPKKFFKIYKNFMNTGIRLHNEIILDAFTYLSDIYSDYVIEYLSTDFNITLFEDTSGSGNKLSLAKDVISKFSLKCSKEKYDILEYKIMHYIHPKAKEVLKERIDFNREKNGEKVYWRYWGFFQKEILPILPKKRMSITAKNMLRELNLAIPEEKSYYSYDDMQIGSVVSPISEKELTPYTWKGIILNEKIKNNNKSKWYSKKGVFVHNSLEQFAQSFGTAVSKNLDHMITMILEIDSQIPDIYIDYLYLNIESSPDLNTISNRKIELLFTKFGYDLNSQSIISICKIIEKKEDTIWSRNTIKMLKEISTKHPNPSDFEYIGKDSKEDRLTANIFEITALNTVRGSAALAIAHLVYNDSNLFELFKNEIEFLFNDNNLGVNFATIHILLAVYNINKNWAEEKLIQLLKKDYKLAGYAQSREMFFRLFSNYKHIVKDIILKCYYSNDKRLVRLAGMTVAELYIHFDEFDNLINNYEEMEENQLKAIVDMLVVYIEIPKYNEKAKATITLLLETKYDLRIELLRLFFDNRIDLVRDKNFITKLLLSKRGPGILREFFNYVEKKQINILDYSEVIIKLSNFILENDKQYIKNILGIEKTLLTITLSLYDATINNKQLNKISEECLNIWDRMYEKNFGSTRMLTRKMMEL